jgi:PAS domain S-box-containing protein
MTTLNSRATQRPGNRLTFTKVEQASESRIVELIALERIGRQLNSTFDMDQILDSLIHEAVNVTPATHGSVLLFDEETESLQPYAWHGYTTQQIEALKDLSSLPRQGIIHRVFTTGQAAMIDDVRHDPDYLEIVPSSQSELIIPLCHGHEIVGVLNLESPESNAFGIANERFALTVAQQAAIAIGNARRYAEQIGRENSARRRNAQLRDLIAISHALHMEHTLDDVLDRIVQSIPATGGFNVALLSLVEGEPPMLRRVAAAGIPLAVFKELQQIRHPLSAFVQVLQERYRISRSFFLPHQEREDWEPGLHVYTALAENDSWMEGAWHHQDVLLVPLRDSKGQLLGLLWMDDPQDRRVPTRESIEILELFANEAASAIENAQLYDELELRVQKRTRQLADALQRRAVEANKTRAIVEGISDAVIVFDADGQVALANPATARILGLEPSKLIHCSLEETAFSVLGSRDQEMVMALFQAARLAKQALVSGQELVRTSFRAARRVLHASFSPVTSREGSSLTIVAVFRDITEETELDRMKSEFVSTAAHEMRTPMTSISGYIDLLMLGMLGPISEKQTEFLQVVKANTQRLVTLVNDLLDISKIESEGLKLNLRPTSLAAVVAEVVVAMRKQMESKNQTLTIDVPIDLPSMMADHDRMFQVVVNLLSNAHKYSPDGSEVVIIGRQVAGNLMLDIQDAGIGISKEDQDRIFTRFFRTDNAIQTQESGTGLGLAICREIIESHGGEILVESELGKGSTFRMVFPPSTLATKHAPTGDES